MKYKLLVLDVDGTLLNDAKEISKRTLAALLKVQQMGVRIVLASGRPTYGLMPLAKSLELGNYGGFILSYNGCQIINAQNGEILFERRINPEMLPYLEKKARKNGFALFTYHDDTIITDSPENEHIQNEARLNNLRIIEETEFSAAVDFAPCKCMLVSDNEEALIGLEDHWKRRLNGALDVFRSEPYFLEVVPYGVNKANALGVLLEQLEVTREEIIAIGDGVCDVEIDKLVEYHKSHGKLATLTAVKIAQDKGMLDITKDQAVRAFREKSASDGAPINAGYMVLQPEVFDMLEGGDACVFEKTALVKLAEEGQLMSYVHTGFWQCMDNIREKSMLEKLLAEDKAPWKRWDRSIPEIPDYAK